MASTLIDGKPALMPVTAWFKHVAGSERGSKHYLDAILSDGGAHGTVG